ncbi:hypothetical protein LJR290_007602 [Variovorax sp. LjRoot290]|uniref:hypothetical protein n=1 Tax=Variovorax sp. LjRoot290 TaxID=3342316 RepID=UPI003ECEF99F
MPIMVTRPSSSEMLRCVARFDDLQACAAGLPDMQLPQYQRVFRNVLGYRQPAAADPAQFSPVGDLAPAAVSHLQAGFGVAFVSALPGKGVAFHVHDTVETFMVMNGRWRVEWEGEGDVLRHSLGPLDFIACPVGVQRRFECEAAEAGRTEGLLLAIIAGEAPAVEYAPQELALMAAAGVVARRPGAA